MSNENYVVKEIFFNINRINDGLPKMALDIKTQKPNNYWTAEKTLEEARRIYSEYGYLPTQKELYNIGSGSLPTFAVKHFGGLRNLRELIEKEDKETGSLLEHYVGGNRDE